MIEIQRAGGLLWLRLNRPEKANALNRAMLDALAAELARAAQTDIAALVLTGSGKTFSAGADLDEARKGLARDPIWERISGAIAALPCLTIAALNGTVAGGALGMALACDLRVAVPQARFFYPAMRLGFRPQPSDPPRLTALIGPARTKMLLLCGWKAGAEQALAWGLIDHIAPAESLEEMVEALAADALAAAPGQIADFKAQLR